MKKYKEHPMRLFLAIFLPFALFFTIGRPVAGIVCLILQITVLGWIPAALWAVYSLSQFETERKITSSRSHHQTAASKPKLKKVRKKAKSKKRA